MMIRNQFLLLASFVLVSGPASWAWADSIPANCKATGGRDPYSHEPTYHCTQSDGTKRLCGAADIKDKRAGCTAAARINNSNSLQTVSPVINGAPPAKGSTPIRRSSEQPVK